MKYGSAHVDGLYNYPDDGEQFKNGCDSIWDLGLRTLKVYATPDYENDYPEQDVWSGVATNLTELVSLTEYTTQFARDWDTVVLTAFTFANGTTNWWMVDVSNTKLDAEYDELYDLAVHLLTTYNNSGKTFILQNWEGDWAFSNLAGLPSPYVDRKYVDNYAAFLNKRQKAIADARRDTAFTNVKVLMAVEVNRVGDARQVRRRIINDIASKINPDIVSYSAYDSTIADIGYGADQADWESMVTVSFTQALNDIRRAFPNKPIYIGEFGYPENEVINERPLHDVGLMVLKTKELAEAFGCKYLLFWEVFDNEPSIPYTTRGYWMVEPDGTITPSGLQMQSFAAE